MKIYANGKRRANWRRSDDRSVKLIDRPPPLCGRFLSRQEAERALAAKAQRRGLVVAVVAGASLTAGLIVFAARGAAGEHALLLAACVALFVALNFWPETGRYRRAMARYGFALLPEPGAQVRLEADHVIYAGEAIPWRDLEPMRLDVVLPPGDTDVIEIDGLLARAGDRRIAFDRYALENGAAIVDAAYDRLIRQRGVAA